MSDYRACVAQGLRGRKLPSKEARRAEFCVVAKLCSSKAKDRTQAILLCTKAHPEMGQWLKP